jgi:K+/H+ antiporter YhaU regulatory subunit KhtT
MDVPPSLVGKTLIESAIRSTSECSVIAIDGPDGMIFNPEPKTTLPPNARLVLIGGAESQEKFVRTYSNRKSV